jgi:glyoxylase-like metal-dependent hydrolase (beta-lactamase superfamily II)
MHHGPKYQPQYQWKLLRTGPIRLDGGGMFGVIPRVLWSRGFAPDEQNRITLAQNSLLLHRADPGPGPRRLLIEVGSGDKFSAKMRNIYGLENRSIVDALSEAGERCENIEHVIVTHLHFDHAGGLTRKAREGEEYDWTRPAPDPEAPAGVKRTFPNARISVQRREWEDAIANRSVMTRTYLRDHLDPIREQLDLADSPAPFDRVPIPDRSQSPLLPQSERETEIQPGIFVFLVPGHTWGQQAVRFIDDAGRHVVFTPDVLPTAHHVGAAYSLAYDVEPYTTGLTKRWFLQAATDQNWLLVLDHEPGCPLQRVGSDGKRWFQLTPEKR